MANAFRAPKSQDFEIINSSGHILGHIRVKPSGIAWRKTDHEKWHRLTLKQFEKFALKHRTVTKQ